MSAMTMLEMAGKLAAAEVAIHINARSALKRVAVKVEATAKAELGTYQDAVGPFPAWAELAESTKDERSRLGYTPNDPLLRSGELLDSIKHDVTDLVATIGSTSEIAEYLEFGTSKMPPRPFIGPAAETNIEAIKRELGGAVVSGMIGGRQIHSSLGYNNVVTSP